jgi:hypothetical protein
MKDVVHTAMTLTLVFTLPADEVERRFPSPENPLSYFGSTDEEIINGVCIRRAMTEAGCAARRKGRVGSGGDR